MEIVYRELTALQPNPKNPRKVTREAVEKLAESIKKNPAFFEARPILLSDRTGSLVIIGGERRSEAARLLGMEKVPTILMPGLSEEQEDEIMVRDNSHAGVWDESMLKKITLKWGADKMNDWLSQTKQIKTPDAQPKRGGDVEFTEILMESHNFVVLYFDNDVDWLNFQTLVGLKSVRSYSTRKDGKIDAGNDKVGVGRVMRGADVLEKLKKIWQG